MKNDPVNHPAHYCSHPSGVEPILLCENMNFNVGNAFKYLYRCTHKDITLQDLRKSLWYINRELELRSGAWFQWFWEDEDFNANFDGNENIRRVLAYEARYGGWMRQALERLYTASVQKRGILALERAYACVVNMIQIQEHRESKSL